MTDATAKLSAAQTREFHFDVASRANDDAIPVVVSTDSAVDMGDVAEILVHASDSVDLRRAPLPIIATHQSGQVNIGVIDGLSISGGQLRGMARFGKRAEAAAFKQDVIDRIIGSVSVGYQRIKSKFRDDGVLVTSKWMPTHAALVAEPADVGAGFFRSRDPAPAFVLDPSDTKQVSPTAAPAASFKEATMAEDNKAAAGKNAEDSSSNESSNNKQDSTQQRATQPSQNTQYAQPRSGLNAMDMENARRKGIENLCRAMKIDDNIRDHFLGSGLSIDKITDDLLAIQESRSTQTMHSDAKLDLSARDTKQYSMMAAIRACADKNWTNAGFELECSREIAKRLNVVVDPNKFYVPFEVQGRELRKPGNRGAGHRDLTAASASGGGYLVGTENMSFIDVLRNRSVAYRMGARRMSGLQGNVTIPRQTAAATAVWMANEASTITESQQTLGQLSLSPKTVGGYTEISRQLMLQSSPDAEAMVTADLGGVCALAIDAGVISGSGLSGQPTGIINTAGIGSVAGVGFIAAAYARALEFQTDVAVGNVMPVAGGYATTPAVAAVMMQAVKWSGTASPIWEGNVWDGSMAGFNAMSSNQMAAASMLFGDWAQVVVGEWGVLQIEVNPYANFQAGIIGVRAMVSVDVGLRYAAAFSLATSIA